MARQSSSSVSALRREVDRLTREVEELTDSFGTESRVAREEAVGAEILASRDPVAHLGILWETMDQLGGIAGRQLHHFSRDYAATASELADAGAGGIGPALGNHAGRRLTHLTEGFGEGLEVMSHQSQKACDALFRLWAPFLSVVRHDWAGRRHGTQG